jgi:membrane protein DedA with SNARE-associated domain
MAEFLDSLFNGLDAQTAYFLLFISAYVENVFPPIPGDTVTVIGAYLAATGRLGVWGVYLSTMLGSSAGFFTMYLIGSIYGRAFLKTRLRARIFSEAQIQKVEVWFARWGYWVLAANRFLAGTRSVVPFFSGTFHLNWLAVLLLSMLSATVWNGLLIYGGFLVGVNWSLINDIISRYNMVIIILTALLAGYLIIRFLKKRRAGKSVQIDLNDSSDEKNKIG